MKKTILITGGNGFLGSYVKSLASNSLSKSHTVIAPSSKEYDLTSEKDVQNLYESTRPNIVIHLAANVGGIDTISNNAGNIFFDNMIMGLYIVKYAHKFGVDRLSFVSSGCSYPKHCPIPFNENDLWNGFPEELISYYAIPKKSLIVMLQAYKKQFNLNSSVVIPSNLYGPNDHFFDKRSHVIPAIVTKIFLAKRNNQEYLQCWGSGEATRDFLYVEDAARAILLAALNINDPDPINIGGGLETSIKDITYKIKKLLSYSGEIIWDTTKPEGQPKRLLDIQKAKSLLGWEPTVGIDEGLKKTIDSFMQTYNEIS